MDKVSREATACMFKATLSQKIVLYIAACQAGTYGQNCALSCSVCNSTGTARCDHVAGCVCNAGYEGGSCGRDINECDNSTVLAECTNKDAVCKNYIGTYKCECRPGYQLNATSNMCEGE
jgi:hypothetical protein